LAAAGFLVHRGPGAALRFLAADAAILVAFFDMFGLALLLVGIAALVASRHGCSPLPRPPDQRAKPLCVPHGQARHPAGRVKSLRDGTAPLPPPFHCGRPAWFAQAWPA